jgi:hypothetical protein
MLRMLYPAAVVLIAITPSLVYAKGGMRLPPPHPVTASIVPTITLPQLSPGDILGGCGRGRYRDAGTHRCRGPAD